MKKLLFVAALGVAGLLSAKGAPVNKIEKFKEKKEVKNDASEKKSEENVKSEVKFQRVCSQWYTIEAPCGATYYLCGNNYWGVEELHEAMDYYNDIKCN